MLQKFNVFFLNLKYLKNGKVVDLTPFLHFHKHITLVIFINIFAD